ncbi:MAG: glycoside hydrolase [Bacteroidetes bacterium]|nr:glycoside hydrolase [Bacteroidota bacterium]
MRKIVAICFYILLSQVVQAQNDQPLILKADDYKHYVERFNTMEDENVKQAIPNDSAWDWMKANIPLFECPQKDFEELFYYRWWTFRKHIEQTPQGYAITEFLVPRTYADKYNLISSALGHHIYESRWLHDKKYMDDNLHIWYRGNDGKPLKKLRFYSSWNIDAIYNRFLVNGDTAFIKDMLPDLEADFRAWQQEKQLPNGLYWQYDVRDAMEETISGGRKEKNARPSINAYMYGNAQALRMLQIFAGVPDSISDSIGISAIKLKKLMNENLWNNKQQFFEVRKEQGDTLSNVREEIGFIPWYFDGSWGDKDIAWKSLTNVKTFCAPYGITTADRSHPLFRTHGCCKCEWDGAVWPFATSQTLTAMANLINRTKEKYVTKKDYFAQLQTLVKSQYVNGKPYIGEYLDEKTGVWLKGEERSRYYNHSTFNDLIITGLVGLRPDHGRFLTVNPLLPAKTWDWFCLDNVLYHGKIITIIWDKTGTKYHKGKGLSLWMNGKKVASSSQLKKITGNIWSDEEKERDFMVR